jgi:hypothetical protein
MSIKSVFLIIKWLAKIKKNFQDILLKIISKYLRSIFRFEDFQVYTLYHEKTKQPTMIIFEG